jgi:hypothetical protein
MSFEGEIIHFLNNMKPTDHVILFYDMLEKKHRILFNYISAGLQKRKGAVYICSEETPEQIRTGMKTFGVDVEKNEKKGRMMIRNYDEWYIRNGQVECLRILANWKETYEKFRKKGLGLLATGETACFFKHDRVRELLRYEYACHKVFDTPMEAICAYNIHAIVDSGHTEVIMPLVRAHGWAIFTGQGGSMIYKPENVEDHDVERLLKIKI